MKIRVENNGNSMAITCHKAEIFPYAKHNLTLIKKNNYILFKLVFLKVLFLYCL